MYKLLVLSGLLVSCLAGPQHMQSSFRDVGQARRPRGCGDRAAAREACALAEEDALAPHPRDCTLFYYCRRAAPPVCRRCPRGLHFNAALQVCDWPENADCAASPPPTTSAPPTDETATTSDLPDSTDTAGTDSSSADASDTSPSVAFTWPDLSRIE